VLLFVRECLRRVHSRDVLERNDVVARLYIGDALSDRLNVTGTLMTEDNGESTLGVFARECVRVGMADTSVVDLDTDFVGSGRKDLNLLDGEVLAGFPGNCSLWFWSAPIVFVLYSRPCCPVTSARCRASRIMCGSACQALRWERQLEAGTEGQRDRDTRARR
jgi:hypothetical protein